MAEVEQLFEKNFLQYASYVIRERAIPALHDGLKPVQRRIIQSLFDMDDGKFHKVANVVGHCMQYHPHGESSIYSALVNLANRGLLIERQGNYGNLFTGDPPSAMRYIECRLLPLAKEILYNPELTQYLPSYDGRHQEPVCFPAKLPLALLLGSEGIAVGMATRILPHNFVEVLQAMQAVLAGKDFTLLPDLPGGGLLDASDYRDGNGKVRSRAIFDTSREGTLRIIGLPMGATTTSLIGSIEHAARRNRVSISQINDYTAAEVEIEIVLPRGGDAEKCVASLYAFSDCEVQLSANLLLIEQGQPVVSAVTQVVEQHTQQLRRILASELEQEQHKLNDQLFILRLEHIFITEKIYQHISNRRSLKGIVEAVELGLRPHLAAEQRPSKDQIDRLLAIPIRRISAYDHSLNRKQTKAIQARLKEIQHALGDLDAYCHRWLQDKIDGYGGQFPRKSQLMSFQSVAPESVASKDYNLFWDNELNFVGYRIETGKSLLSVSEFDRVFLLQGDGSGQIIKVPEKLYLSPPLALCLAADTLAEQDLTLIYQDTRTGFPFLKRCRIGRYRPNRRYQLIPAHGRLLLASATPQGVVKVRFRRQKGSKDHLRFSFVDYPVRSLTAVGSCLLKRICLTAEEVSAAAADLFSCAPGSELPSRKK